MCQDVEKKGKTSEKKVFYQCKTASHTHVNMDL